MERRRTMSDLEKIPESNGRFVDGQKKYNITSKKIVHTIGTNIALVICMLLPVFLIGYIWTDFSVPDIGLKFVTDGIATVVLFVVGETMMMRVGASGGKLDAEYIEARKEYNTLTKKVNDLGTMFMSVFCEWQIDIELKQAVATRIRALHITKDEWKEIKDLSRMELDTKYGKKKAQAIERIKQLKPMELNEAILLFDDAESTTRGGVPISGDGYIHKKSHSIETVLSCAFTGLLTVTVAITMTSDISFARVMYTIYKLIVLFYRMALGYGTGAKAYNSVEVKQLQAKCSYLRQYIRFVEEKTYLKIGDQYGDISCYIDEDEPQPTKVTEVTEPNPTEAYPSVPKPTELIHAN